MIGIRRARKRRGLTQEQLAQMCGVTQGAVAQWECGMTHPSFQSIPALADALGVTVDDLVRGAVEDVGQTAVSR